jgi:hypothetical protein
LSMSTDEQTEQLKAKQHRTEQGGGGHDFDAEHQHDKARGASNAQLKRVASANGVFTPEERGAQRKTTNDQSLEGVRAAAAFAAAEVSAAAHQIDQQMNGELNEGGWELRMKLVQDRVATAEDSARRLSNEVSVAKESNVPIEQIKSTMIGFSQAYRNFGMAVIGAIKKAQDAHQTFSVNTRTLDATVEGLYQTGGWDAKKTVSNSAGQPAPSKDDSTLAHALAANLSALTEGAKMANMSLAGVAQDTRDHDLGRMISHLIEVSHLVQQADHATLMKCRKQVATAMSTVHAMYNRLMASQGEELQTCKNRVANANVASLMHGIEIKALK